MIGSAFFSPLPVCSSVADMPLCVLSARLGVVCESGEASLRVGPSKAAVQGGGGAVGLGAKRECCSLKSESVLT